MGKGPKGGEIPEDLAQQGEVVTEMSMAAEISELTNQGYEEVMDADVVGKVDMHPPDGVVEEWTPALGELENDAEYDYKIVIDDSGTSEITKGKPTIKLFRKPKEQAE